MKVNAQQEQTRPQIAFVRRPPAASQHKVIPIVNDEFHEIKPSTPASEILPQFTSPKDPAYAEATKHSPTTKVHPTPSTISEVSRGSHLSNVFQTKNSSGRIRPWYNGLTSKQKMLLRVGIIGGILLAFATIAILLVVFLLLLRSSSTSTTTTTTTPTTTSSSIVISAAWTFDQTAMDSYGVYNGTYMNGASYSGPLTTQPYIGNGRALPLVAANSQFFMISAPFFNLSYTSFTIEAWIYPTLTTASDHGIFSQCACSTCSNQCLYLIIRSGHLYVDFTFNSLSGSTTISTGTWYHIAFVYNYATKQQILYVNGVQDTIALNAQPYQGTNGSIQIGAAIESPTTYYFNGYIDNVKLTTQALSSTQILFDASVTAYYSFDSSSMSNDNGPNGLNGASNNTALVSGRVNQAMHFSGSASYFQAYGFYQLVYSVSNLPFSFSLWINPSSVASSTIVQMTQLQSSGSCFNFLGILSPAGGLSVTGQLVMQGYNTPVIYGPFLTINTWTHVSLTYSSATGMIVYVNGVLFGSTGPFTFSNTGYITWLQIGYIFTATVGGSVPNAAYQGSIDEVYVHSRQLTQAEITGLANP